MSATLQPKPILPRWALALLLLSCGAGLYLLLPDDARLIEDLLRDGKIPEARRQWDRVAPSDRAREPDRYRRLALQLTRRELPAGAGAALVAYWDQAVAAWRDSGFAEEIFAELAPVMASLLDVAPAWALVAPDFPRVPPGQRHRLAAGLVRAALAANQPAVAATVFAADHPPTDRTETAALELARLWQLAGQPETALAALGEDPAPAVAARRLELLRALNRNREVLALLRARADSAPGSELAPAELEELVTVALQAGQPAEAVPYLQHRVATHSDDLAAWRRLRDLLVSAGTPHAAIEAAAQATALGGKAAEDVRAQGRILEWAGAPAAAFDAWLDLALRGDLEAIDRLIALNPGLYRDGDLMQALTRLVPLAGHPDYTLLLARLEVIQGRYDAALDHFDRYLADHGDDADTLVEVARVHIALNRFAAAEDHLRRAERLRPTDAVIQGELAATLVFEGRNSDALALYARLAEQAPTEEVLDPYTRLAESLGRYDELARGIRRRIELAATPVPRDYLMLAYAYELGANAAARRATLAEGLRRLPDSDEVRLQLASALSDERNYVEAQTVLADHRRLHDEPIAAALYLELMRLNNDTAAERRFLAVPLTGALALDENVREHVAQAHEALHDYAVAEQMRRDLLAERPDDPSRTADLARVLLLRGRSAEAAALLAPLLRSANPPLLRLAAEIAVAAGKSRDAERYQRAYLAAMPGAPASDWSALGDICLSRGDRHGARQAYTEALRRMQAQLVSKGRGP